jgi:hypothetical protein
MNVPIVPSFKHTGLRSIITEFALSLVAEKDGIFLPSGTATVIAPFVAVTARHVVEDFWKYFETTEIRTGDRQTTFHLRAFQVLDEGAQGAFWNVSRMWLSPHTDVAFLCLTPFSPEAGAHVWRSLHLNLLPPPIGSTISGFGYHSSSIIVVERTEQRTRIEWKDEPTTTMGEVLEIHEARRDAARLHFPCFRTNARFDGGMSGGPVFNQEGQLCGIICSSLPPGGGSPEHTSYVTTLWPSMGTVIDVEREDLPAGTRYPILDAAERGFIKALHWERVILVDRQGDLVRQVGLRSDSRQR